MHACTAVHASVLQFHQGEQPTSQKYYLTKKKTEQRETNSETEQRENNSETEHMQEDQKHKVPYPTHIYLNFSFASFPSTLFENTNETKPPSPARCKLSSGAVALPAWCPHSCRFSMAGLPICSFLHTCKFS
jgi:hypothetical protein